MRFITDYRRINQQLVIKTYPLPRMYKTIQKMEVFQYAFELYINMGYYTIMLLTAGQDMTMIVIYFCIYRYDSIPMGMCDLGYIFQARVDKILSDIEGVKTYIEDILVLSKKSFSQHTEQLRIIFGRLRAAGLKFNATS